MILNRFAIPSKYIQANKRGKNKLPLEEPLRRLPWSYSHSSIFSGAFLLKKVSEKSPVHWVKLIPVTWNL